MKVHVPFLIGPELEFRVKQSPASIDKFKTQFRAWFRNPNELQFSPSEEFRLTGIVIKHPSYPDGSPIGTSRILVIEKALKDTDLSDLLCAITKSGSRYFFRGESLGIRSL